MQEEDEQARLAEMASRGLVTLPKRTSRNAFQSPVLPSRGKLASEMVLEDRRLTHFVDNSPGPTGRKNPTQG